ncbi:MAG: gamma-glutamylcyclotransferase family protein [bacterium]
MSHFTQYNQLMTVHYFAYGSNMDPDRMIERRAFFTDRVFARLENYKLVFNKISNKNPEEGFGNIIPDGNSVVEGVLYEVEWDAIECLDIKEGYPAAYSREEIEVELSDGGKVEALVYIAREDKTRDGLKPSREYLSHYLKGKDLLSEEYYSWLETIETFD